MYVNDLFYCDGLDAQNTIMYADDTVIYSSSDMLEDAFKEQNDKVSKVVEWCNQNKLTINETKTKYTIFNNKIPDSDLAPLQCKGHSLDKVASSKYLGVDVTEDLSMNEYVTNVYKKGNYKVFMFSKIRKYITQYAAKMIYKQTILPYMDYSCFLMDSACDYSLSKLDKIQKRCLRLIEFKNKIQRERDLNVLMANYNIEPIRQRRNRQLLHFMYNESKTLLNLNKRNINITLRSDNKVKFKEKLTRKTTIQNSPYYRGIQLWNTLPANVQKSESLTVFKRKIKGIKQFKV